MNRRHLTNALLMQAHRAVCSRLLPALTLIAVLLLAGTVGCQRSDEQPPAEATPASARSDGSTAQVTGDDPGETRAQPAADHAENSAADPPTSDRHDGPYIQFDAMAHDFGVMDEFETRSTTLSFTNTGSEPLRILDISTTCGCTVANKPKKQQYAPGESGEIEITFDPSGPNTPGKPQKKYVNVVTNSTTRRTTQILITADVQAFIELEPRFVDLGQLAHGVEHHYDVTVSCPDPMFTIAAVHTSNPHITTQVLDNETAAQTPSDDGRSTKTRIIRLTVSPDAPWGRLFSWLQVTITGRPSPLTAPKTHSSRIRVQGQIFGNLAADPDTFRFGAQPGESFERVILLSHRQGLPFTIVRVESAIERLDDIVTETKRIAPSQWEVILRATAGRTAGPSSGVVTVQTDLPGDERTIDLPVSGVVRQPRQ